MVKQSVSVDNLGVGARHEKIGGHGPSERGKASARKY